MTDHTLEPVNAGSRHWFRIEALSPWQSMRTTPQPSLLPCEKARQS